MTKSILVPTDMMSTFEVMIVDNSKTLKEEKLREAKRTKPDEAVQLMLDKELIEAAFDGN